MLLVPHIPRLPRVLMVSVFVFFRISPRRKGLGPEDAGLVESETLTELRNAKKATSRAERQMKKRKWLEGKRWQGMARKTRKGSLGGRVVSLAQMS